MPHVSKHYIKQEIFESIFANFSEVLCSMKNKKESKMLSTNLFTKTERLMLAKRLMIIYMLSQGKSGYFIWHALKVSPSTVTRITVKFEKGEFNFLEKFFKKRKSFGFLIEKLFDFMPAYGKARWDFLNKH